MSGRFYLDVYSMVFLICVPYARLSTTLDTNKRSVQNRPLALGFVLHTQIVSLCLFWAIKMIGKHLSIHPNNRDKELFYIDLYRQGDNGI